MDGVPTATATGGGKSRAPTVKESQGAKPPIEK